MADRVGQQLGNYRLLRLLGRGGFAEVYLGEHLYLRSRAALKVLHTQLTDEDAQRFVQEAQTLAGLSHPHIVRVLDFAIQEGLPFLVMEYAPGGTLRTRHPRQTRLPLETIVAYVNQVAQALQFAHDHRLIHRDVKPENMLLSSKDDVLLSDFGLAMLAPPTLSASTRPIAERVVGTFPYTAPEQLQGEAGPASDQYALGVVVYEWLTGTPPFHGSPLEIAMQHLSMPPPALAEQVPDLPPAVEEVLLRTLAKDPKLRFASVHDFASTLEQASHEAAYRQLMDLYATNGDRAAALRTYHAYATVLERELAAEPSRATRDAYERLLQAEEPMSPREAPRAPLVAQAPLIGRTGEWAQLQEAWRVTMTGRPHLVVLLGEAGIGKTRLAEELVSWVRRLGLAFASARCYATEEGLAYTPVRAWLHADALRTGLSTLPALWLTEVARLLPDLLLTHPDLPRPGPLMEGWQREHFFEALACAMLGTGQPLLLVLDDLQWCDRETLAWLHYLLRFDPDARLLLVATLRSEELTPENPLASFLLTLRREALLTEIDLGPLDAAETASLAEHVAQRELPSHLAAALYQETEGNPLFTLRLSDGTTSSMRGNEDEGCPGFRLATRLYKRGSRGLGKSLSLLHHL